MKTGASIDPLSSPPAKKKKKKGQILLHRISVDKIHKAASDQRSRNSVITQETYRNQFGKN